MSLLNISKNLAIGIILLSFGASCSTQLEERASMDFEPAMPGVSKSQKKINTVLFTAIVNKDSLQQIDERLK